MCYLRRIAKIRFLPVFQIWLTLRPKKNKKLLFYGHWTRYDLLRGMTSAFLIFRSFGHSYGRSRQKGRTCRRHAMTDFMSNVNTKSVSATPAYGTRKKTFNYLIVRLTQCISFFQYVCFPLPFMTHCDTSHGRHSRRLSCLLGLFMFARIACLLQLWIKTRHLDYSIWATPK